MTDRRNDENTIDDENKTKHNKKKQKQNSNKKLATISTVIAVAIELFDGNGDAQKRKCN